LVHSTVAYNLALSLDDIYARRVYVKNSIVLKASRTDCLSGSGTEIILEGNNLACWSASDGDLHLGPLADNGGRTQTLALLEGSPAIDGGNPAGCLGKDDLLLYFDQRGFNRHLDGDKDGSTVCDIGAFELSHNVTMYLPLLVK